MRLAQETSEVLAKNEILEFWDTTNLLQISGILRVTCPLAYPSEICDSNTGKSQNCEVNSKVL